MKEYKVRVYNDRTEWWFNGQLHREDGPAVEWSDEEILMGSKKWYLNGKCLSEEEFNIRTQSVEMTVAEISKALGKNIKIVKE